MATLANRRALRALGAIRRSKRMSYEDPSTTPARQEAAIRTEEGPRVEIVGWARDLGVSAGDIPPWERPQLGPWMTTEKVAEYDAIIWAKYDRAIRHMRDMHKLSEWAIQHRKIIIFVVGPNDGPRMELDFRNGPLDTMANLYLMLFAFAAEMEWNTIRERNRDTAAYLRQQGRWGGGRYPYHLIPVKMGKEWRLIHNPETAEVVREAIRLILEEGKNLSEVAEIFTERGIPAPFDYAAAKAKRLFTSPVSGRVVSVTDKEVVIAPADGGKEVAIEPHNKRDIIAVKRGDQVKEGERLSVPPIWHRNALGKILRSKSLIGLTEIEGKPIFDENGMQVKRADPLVDRETYRRLVEAIQSTDEDGEPVKRRPKNAGEFLGIAWCIRCGFNMHKADRKAMKGGEKVVYRYVRCYQAYGKARAAGPGQISGCDTLNLRTEHISEIVQAVLIANIGHLEVMERRYVPGADHEAELEEAQESLNYFLSEVAKKGPSVAKVYRGQIVALEALIEKLEKTPATEDRFEEVPTGVTYRMLWDNPDSTKMRKLLLESGIRIEVGDAKDGSLKMGNYKRPDGCGEAIIVGVDQGIAYAIYLPADLAKRATGREIAASYHEAKLNLTISSEADRLPSIV